MQLLFHLWVCAVLIFLLVYFWWSWKIDCIRTLNIWNVGYLFIVTVSAIERLVVIVLWLTAREPSMAESRTFLFVRMPNGVLEIAWVIYGSTFVWSQEIADCKETTQEAGDSAFDRVGSLRITAQVLIVFGYCYIAFVIVSVVGVIFMFKAYKSYISYDLENRQKMSEQ